MRENIKMLKSWYKLVQSKRKYFVIQFLTNLLGDITLMMAAVPAAKLIVSLNNGNYNDAYFWLWIGFAILFVRQFGWHAKYMNAQKLIE